MLPPPLCAHLLQSSIEKRVFLCSFRQVPLALMCANTAYHFKKPRARAKVTKRHLLSRFIVLFSVPPPHLCYVLLLKATLKRHLKSNPVPPLCIFPFWFMVDSRKVKTFNQHKIIKVRLSEILNIVCQCFFS